MAAIFKDSFPYLHVFTQDCHKPVYVILVMTHRFLAKENSYV